MSAVPEADPGDPNDHAVGTATMAGVCAAGAVIALVIAVLLTLFVQYVVRIA